MIHDTFKKELIMCDFRMALGAKILYLSPLIFQLHLLYNHLISIAKLNTIHSQVVLS